MSGQQKEKTNRLQTSTVLLLALVVGILLVIGTYAATSQRQIWSYARSTIEQNTEAISNEVDAYLSNAESSIRLTSHLTTQTMTGKVLNDAGFVLDALAEQTPFSFIEYIEQDGTNTTDKGEKFDASDRVYYREGIVGNTGVWVNYHPRYAQEYLLNFYTPLFYQHEIVGVLTGTMGADTDILPLLKTSFFGEEMISILCDEDRQVIASTRAFEGDLDLSELLLGLTIYEESVQDFLKHIDVRDTTVFEFNGSRGPSLACVRVNERTGWSIVQIVPAAAFKSIMNHTAGRAYLATGLICLLLTLYLLYIVLTARKHHLENEEKMAEQIVISNTDELTGLFNRRAYEDDLHDFPDIPPEADFVYLSADVNGLKIVNDTQGHAAGDMLLKAAAQCLKRCLGAHGKLYRIGGDEFAAIFFAGAEQLDFIRADLEESMLHRQDTDIPELSVSIGMVSKREFPALSVAEMARIADSRMYAEKTAYYRNRGIDRRGQQLAFAAVCATYTKILRIDLTTDTYRIICMDTAEQIPEKGFADQISVWLHNFGTSGQVHPDDLAQYLQAVELSALRAHFRSGKDTFSIFYRRLIDGNYRRTMMELLPTADYTDANQTLYLYVKDIDTSL